MSFAHPWAFALGLLAIPLVLLYGRATRMPQRVVATDWLWEQALAEERLRTRWQKYRSAASLALHLVVLALVTLALAGPQIPGPRYLAIVIDNSESMGATDGSGTRLDAAKAVARGLLASMRDCDRAIVITSAGVPSQRTGLTADQEVLKSALDNIRVTDGETALEWTLHTIGAAPLAQVVSYQVVVITDFCTGDSRLTLSHEEKNPGLSFVNIGQPINHVAITRCAGRRSRIDPRACDLLVELQNISAEAIRGSLTITLDGKLQSTHPLTVSGDGTLETYSGPVKHGAPEDERGWEGVLRREFNHENHNAIIAPAGGTLAVRFEAAEKTNTGLNDNQAVIELPPARMHRVRFESDQRSFVWPALRADHRVELVDAITGGATVTSVFDGNLPGKLPVGPILVFHPSDCDLWQIGKAISDPEVSQVGDNSAVFRGIRLRDVFLADARELKLADSTQGMSTPILWAESGQPLAYAIDRPEGRIVVIGGDLATGNLALQAGFPQIVSQSLDWLAGNELSPDDVVYAPDTSRSAASSAVDLRTLPEWKSNVSSEITKVAGLPLRIYPAGIAMVMMIVEWCLYQRRWLC